MHQNSKPLRLNSHRADWLTGAGATGWILRVSWGSSDASEPVVWPLELSRKCLKAPLWWSALVKHLSGSKSPCRDGRLVGSFRKTQDYINNESFKTSTAITCWNLYITTKSLVPLHQGICLCHTVQLPSSYNCCISMRFCKTTRVLVYVLRIGYLYSFTCWNQRLHPHNFLHGLFVRVTEYFNGLLECTFGRIVYGEHWGEKRECEGEKKRREAGSPISCCCSGSVGQRHAARTHMQSRLNSSADSNCPSVVSLGKHVSRHCRVAAQAR